MIDHIYGAESLKPKRGQTSTPLYMSNNIYLVVRNLAQSSVITVFETVPGLIRRPVFIESEACFFLLTLVHRNSQSMYGVPDSRLIQLHK